MKPGQKLTSSEVASLGWVWTANSEGALSYDAMKTATLVAIHGELVTLNNQLRSLGSDGIHTLIRAGLTEVRALKKKRLARGKK